MGVGSSLIGTLPEPQPGQVAPVKVQLSREPWGDFFVFTWNFHLDQPDTAELEPDEARKWLKDHGADNEEANEKALDECWNFYRAVAWIRNWKEPAPVNPGVDPQL